MKKKYNYKFIIGLIIGILLVTGVSAVTSMEAQDIVYDSEYSKLSTGDVQGAIDDLANQIERPDECQEGYYCTANAYSLSPGDYVSYTPASTSYTTDTDYTGYTSTQIINPSELNLWRVLYVHDDGRIEMISEYVSSTEVYMKGLTGYLNMVGYLNVLASQYETDGITVGSRHFGYYGRGTQTEFITDTPLDENDFVFGNCFTNAGSTSCFGSYTEKNGIGDTGYLYDHDLVYDALGTRRANMVGTSNPTMYWAASRYYNAFIATRYIDTEGYIADSHLDGGAHHWYSLRPIVFLDSSHAYEGSGTAEDPWRIIRTK